MKLLETHPVHTESQNRGNAAYRADPRSSTIDESSENQKKCGD